MKIKDILRYPLILVILFVAHASIGQLSINPIFSDGVVIQQNRPINVWGEADPWEFVSVEINSVEVQVCADQQGSWFAQLTNTLELGETYQLKVADAIDTLIVEDLVSGDVWIASGQSNMQYRLHATAVDNVILHIDTLREDQYDNFRIFEVEKITASSPRSLLNEDAPPISSNTLKANQWLKMRDLDTILTQSGVAYYFGRKLHRIFEYPIGIINATRGSTNISAWMPESLETDTFEIPDESYFNGMIAPLMPLEHKGLIFWHGENNIGDFENYSEKLSANFNEWRNLWGYEFDVHNVLLNNYGVNRHRLRNEQISASLKGKDLHMVTSFDIGGPELITINNHPPQRKLIGERLAYSALTHTYDLPNYHRPIPQPIAIQVRNDSTLVFVRNDGEPLMELNQDIPDSTFRFSTTDAPDEVIYSASARFISDTVIYLHGFPPDVTVSNISYNHAGYAEFHIKDSYGTPMNQFDTSFDSSYVFKYEFKPVQRDEVNAALCILNNPLTIEEGRVSAVGVDWVRVSFTETFISPVVVATPVLLSSSSEAVITRVQNLDSSGFDLKVQGAGGDAPQNVTVYWVAVEEGTYTAERDGIKMEAHTFTSTQTAGKSAGWEMEVHEYNQSYVNPVVLGQVMSHHDARFSVFWSSNDSVSSPASSSSLRAGKHVSGDLDIERADETVGMIIIEAGSGDLNGLIWQAGVGSDSVEGAEDNPSGHKYSIDVTDAHAAILSAAGMNGGDGGWPVLFGDTPLSDSDITLVFDEDQFEDTERGHSTEQVAYFVLGRDHGLVLEHGIADEVTTEWTTIMLTEPFVNPVVVTTPLLASAAHAPVITRIRNVTKNSFDLKVQDAGGDTPDYITVHWIAVEEGIYTVEDDGIRMEARSIISDKTAGKTAGWDVEAHDYNQAYTSPVVLGQVMSYYDSRFSVFWSSNGSVSSPANSSSLRAGKHISGDPDTERATETVGVIIIEAGSGDLNGLTWQAGVGSDHVEGAEDNPSGYTYTIDVSGASTAILSVAGMDGGDGGWPVLFGDVPLNDSEITLAFDEDQFEDTERGHTTEQVAYFVLGRDYGLVLEHGIANGVNTDWTTITLTEPFANPVVVTTPILASATDAPFITRIRNVTKNGFDLKVQDAGGDAPNNTTVHWIAVEEGTYTPEDDGIKMEAWSIISDKTAGKTAGWDVEAHAYNQSYTNPVVLGQVMSYYDSRFSIFWSSNGSVSSPATSSSLRAGKHVSGDPDTERADETVGMMIIEAGSGDLNGLTWQAGVGSDSVEGAEDNPSGYTYSIDVTGAGTALLSAAGMDGGDGGWPVLFGAAPLSDSELTLAFDEDQFEDTERGHTTEQVAYFVLGEDLGLVLEHGIANEVSTDWTTIALTEPFEIPVVVATPTLASATDAPVITRLRNVTKNSFDLKVQDAGGDAPDDITVHWIAVEEGVYTVEDDGIKMEARSIISDQTAGKTAGWDVEFHNYQQPYTNPVVLGQVMSYYDSRFSVFWCSNGSVSSPATSSSLRAGKHVSGDPDTERADETVGMIIVEAGSGDLNGLTWQAGVGSDSVEGAEDNPSGYTYPIDVSGASTAVLSAAGMNGGDGGWPVLFSDAPLHDSEVTLAFDEDQFADTERGHVAEQVAYLIVGQSSDNANGRSATPVIEKDASAEEVLIAYPNPNNGLLDIQINGGSSIVEVHLIELNGSVTDLRPFDQDKHVQRFDISGREPGLYLLQVVTESHIYNMSLLIN